MGGELPHQLFVGELLRDRDGEDVLVPPRGEVRRLSAIAARLEGVGGADRNVDRFLVIAVHVAEPHVHRAVRVDVESFVDRRDTLTGPVPEVRQLRRGLLREHGAGRDRTEKHREAHGSADHAGDYRTES